MEKVYMTVCAPCADLHRQNLLTTSNNRVVKDTLQGFSLLFRFGGRITSAELDGKQKRILWGKVLCLKCTRRLQGFECCCLIW